MNKIKKAFRMIFDYANNWPSILGIIGTSVSAICVLTLLALDLLGFLPDNNYVYVVLFVVLPSFFAIGLLLIPLGMLYHKRFKSPPSRAEGEQEGGFSYPKLDFNNPRTRLKAFIITTLTLANVVIIASISYKAIDFSGSVKFCGESCHHVMGPEYAAFQETPHARIKCASCHVGPGAQSFVQSKIKGSKQLYHVLLNSYPRPIKTPIQMRPANEICEQCHWPGKVHSDRAIRIQRYDLDEHNTERIIRLVMKTGWRTSGKDLEKLEKGIHWHILNPVWYVAADASKQDIPWVQVRSKGGHTLTFKAKDTKWTDAQIQAAPKHKMDCMDCHNRAAHAFDVPDRALDKAIASKRLDKALPYVKKQSLTLLSTLYPNDEKAKQAFQTLKSFYQRKYPQISAKFATQIDQAVDTLFAIYKRTQFPHMKIDWRTYPDHIGHRDALGCLRCHGGKHFTQAKQPLKSDCNVCHALPDHQEMSHVRPEKHRVECTKCHSIATTWQNHHRDIRPTRAQCLDCHKKMKETLLAAKAQDPQLVWKHECTHCHSVHNKLDLTKPQALCANCHGALMNKEQHKQHLANGLDCGRCHTNHIWKVDKIKVKKVCSECHTEPQKIDALDSFRLDATAPTKSLPQKR